MLVLSRKRGESIRIADDIEVTVIEVVGSRVKLGFRAPSNVKIIRPEVVELKQKIDTMQDAKHEHDVTRTR